MYTHKNFLKTIWEFSRGVEESRDIVIQIALKVHKTFKVKSLKTPELDVPPSIQDFLQKYMREKKN